MSTCLCGCGRGVQNAYVRGHNRRTHGHESGYKKTRTYRSWAMMRDRCLNPNATGYANYGGRGIEVCGAWDKFEQFLCDMGERPEGRTLDRIDVDGNYEPTNCRWATRSEQRRNIRSVYG